MLWRVRRAGHQPFPGTPPLSITEMTIPDDPETPEPELTRAERKAERRRLRAVRRERRRLAIRRGKDRKNRAKGKDDKKGGKKR